MKYYYGFIALILIAGLALAGCLHPIPQVIKRCKVGYPLGETTCQCRNAETGRFVRCP